MSRVAIALACVAVAAAAPLRAGRGGRPLTLDDIPSTSHIRSELARCASQMVCTLHHCVLPIPAPHPIAITHSLALSCGLHVSYTVCSIAVQHRDCMTPSLSRSCSPLKEYNRAMPLCLPHLCFCDLSPPPLILILGAGLLQLRTSQTRARPTATICASNYMQHPSP